MNLVAAIMAGGNGLRLWPISTPSLPKQFIKFDEFSLFQRSVLRNQKLNLFEIVVITTAKYLDIVISQLKEINAENCPIIVEDIGKNTAFSACLIAQYCKLHKIEQFLLMPADHIILGCKHYARDIKKLINTNKAKQTACLLGVKPENQESSYGYIITNTHEKIKKIVNFREKPNLNEIAEFTPDNYYWNLGIYSFNTDFFEVNMQAKKQNIFDSSKEAFKFAKFSDNQILIDRSYYEKIEYISIDHALTEQLKNMYMIEATFIWKDIGTWNNLWQSRSIDHNQNYIDGNVLTKDVQSSYIQSKNLDIIAIGLKDLVIVHENGKLLIAKKDNLDSLKKLVFSEENC